MRLLIILIFVFQSFTLPLAAQEDAPNREDIIRLLARMDELIPVEQDFKELGFEGENLDLAMAQYRRIFRDRDIAGFVADRLMAAYSGTLPSAVETGGLLGPLIDRGIGHLPIADLVYFYRVENTVFNALSTRECGLAVKQRLPEQRLSDATARAAARLNTPALREYYRIQYRAARMGLTRSIKQLSAADAARIEAVIGERIFEGADSAASQALIRTFENPRNATNRQACEAGRTIMNTVLTLEGRDLRDALIYFSAP